MKLILTLLILLLASTSAYSQFVDTWNIDWQSQESNGCAPASFIIGAIQNGSNTTYTVNYTFSALATSCPYNITNYASNLTLNSTTGVYADSQNNSLSYNADAQTIIFTNSTSIYGNTFLFDKNGSYIPQEAAFGLIAGTWVNATFINGTTGVNASKCCVPNSFYIYPDEEQEYKIVTGSNFTSRCASQNTSWASGLPTASTSFVNWTAFDGNVNSYTSYILFPYSSPNQLTVQFSYIDSLTPQVDYTCTYSYQKSTTNVNMINGSWTLDWQSSNYQGDVAQNITVTNINNSYMVANLSYFSGPSFTYFVPTGTSPYQYLEPISEVIFKYDPSTNTLMSAANSSTPPTVLYSQNGSLINDPLSESYWNNSQPLGSAPLPSSCCIPTLLQITNSQGSFFALYSLSSNYAGVSGCQDIIQSVESSDELKENQLTIPNSKP